mgnify:CR=1 FL=1
MLRRAAEKRRQEKARLLESLGVTEYFNDGTIRIERETCEGIECGLCIKTCPTNALYWAYGEVKIIEDLCIYCAACVLCCIVDKCIVIARRRTDGTVETFSTPAEVRRLLTSISSKRRVDAMKHRFQSMETYLEKALSDKDQVFIVRPILRSG